MFIAVTKAMPLGRGKVVRRGEDIFSILTQTLSR
jgi:hypothetical protein